MAEERNIALKAVSEKEAMLEQLRKEAIDRDVLLLTLRKDGETKCDLALQTLRNELEHKEAIAEAQYRKDLSDSQLALAASRKRD